MDMDMDMDCKLLPFYSKEQMEGFLDMTQLIKESSLDWSSLDSYIQESSTYGGQIWSLPLTFDMGTIAALSCQLPRRSHLVATDVIILHLGDRHALLPQGHFGQAWALAARHVA